MTCVAVRPVPSLTMVTVAPGSTPPDESVTRPSIRPVMVCAQAGGLIRTMAKQSNSVSGFVVNRRVGALGIERSLKNTSAWTYVRDTLSKI